MKLLTLAALLAGLTGAVGATPVGLWKTIDDETGQPRSHVRITERDGRLSGRIEKLLVPPATPDCVKCSDERKGQPIEGLTILRGVRRDGEANWGGGDILDPKSGKVYSVRLTELDDGRRLEVRGFIGVPLIGRTQVWERLEP
ncbi:DUF2147 domain-containing protein [Derxia gummosa]|uniref:DUF2147 domain-containing protein n=1 Tax=Derxia gummosa DSM 723 TaxID=1121388 RepID=A0A8B6X8N8_9BURK|nr:DUF2147 domain-containing protein [Derxia gummosa]